MKRSLVLGLSIVSREDARVHREPRDQSDSREDRAAGGGGLLRVKILRLKNEQETGKI